MLISGYMMGSPTSDRAQCLGSMPSAKRSGFTPGTPKRVYVCAGDIKRMCFASLSVSVLDYSYIGRDLIG